MFLTTATSAAHFNNTTGWAAKDVSFGLGVYIGNRSWLLLSRTFVNRLRSVPEWVFVPIWADFLVIRQFLNGETKNKSSHASGEILLLIA